MGQCQPPVSVVQIIPITHSRAWQSGRLLVWYRYVFRFRVGWIEMNANATQALVVYDALLTIEAERRFIWCRKLGFASLIFATNRITAIFMTIVMFLAGFSEVSRPPRQLDGTKQRAH